MQFWLRESIRVQLEWLMPASMPSQLGGCLGLEVSRGPHSLAECLSRNGWNGSALARTTGLTLPVVVAGITHMSGTQILLHMVSSVHIDSSDFFHGCLDSPLSERRIYMAP